MYFLFCLYLLNVGSIQQFSEHVDARGGECLLDELHGSRSFGSLRQQHEGLDRVLFLTHIFYRKNQAEVKSLVIHTTAANTAVLTRAPVCVCVCVCV